MTDLSATTTVISATRCAPLVGRRNRARAGTGCDPAHDAVNAHDPRWHRGCGSERLRRGEAFADEIPELLVQRKAMNDLRVNCVAASQDHHPGIVCTFRELQRGRVIRPQVARLEIRHLAGCTNDLLRQPL